MPGSLLPRHSRRRQAMIVDDQNRSGSGIPYANGTIIRAGHSRLRKCPSRPSGVHPDQYWVLGRSGGKITVPPPDPPGR